MAVAFAQPVSAAPPRAGSGVDDLPLVTVAARQPGDTLAVLLSGDGGWAELDRALASALAAHGITVIGWDSLRYYWTPRTPEGAARDLARILAHYGPALRRQRIVLIGYSLGADVLPFLVRRLPAEWKAHIEKIVLLGPGTYAHFEFKLIDWLGGTRGRLDVYSEVAQLTGTPLLCIRGAKEPDSLCPRLAPTVATTITLPGGHHFDRDYPGLARLIRRWHPASCLHIRCGPSVATRDLISENASDRQAGFLTGRPHQRPALFSAYQQHRFGGDAYYALGDAAEEQMAQSGAAMGADHDQVRWPGVGVCRDRFGDAMA